MSRAAESAGPYQLFMLMLSVLVLAMLGIRTVGTMSAATLEILDLADTGVCLIFFADFVATYWRAERKLRYLATWGWLDLMSSIPTIDVLRWGRTARVFRILRLLRGFRATRLLASLALARRVESAFWATLLVAMLSSVFASIAILQFEGQSSGGIKTAADAMWWSLVTITTVGYGDLYPVTSMGRLLASGLMLVGIAVFGSMTACLASWFVATEDDTATAELAGLRREVHALRLELQLVNRTNTQTGEGPER